MSNLPCRECGTVCEEGCWERNRHPLCPVCYESVDREIEAALEVCRGWKITDEETEELLR